MKTNIIIQSNRKKLKQLYLLRIFGLFCVLGVSIIMSNLLINYFVQFFMYITKNIQTWNLAPSAKPSAVTYFSFHWHYLVSLPTQVPGFLSVLIAVVFTCFKGWKIIMKFEKAKKNVEMDYNYMDVEGSSRWATDKEVKARLTSINKQTISDANLGGIILVENEDSYFADTKITNTLVLGKTRSGKGIFFILPTARFMAMCREKISMVITDPKIENYELLYSTLQENGYRIWLINYRDPEKGLGCNNLYAIIREYKIAMQKDEEERNFSKVSELIAEFSFMHTMNAKSDPIWPESAQALLEAILFYLLDVGYKNNTIESLNMYTVRVFFVDKGTREVTLNNKIRTVELDLLFQSLPLESNARQKYATSKFAEGEMRSSIFSTLSSNLAIYADAGLAKMTSSSEIDFTLLADPDRPTALFLGIPDDKQSRHKLAAITIKQIYAELVDVSQQCKNNMLNRRVCIMADEIGNMPPFPNLDNMLQVSLGRNIMWHLYIQNLAQLDKVYGEKEARIIRDSVSNLVYIYSSDPVTNKDISEQLGCETKVYQTTSGEHGSFLEADHVQGHMKGRPLMTPDELRLLQEGELVVIKDRSYPMKTQREPFYNLNIPRTPLEETDIPVSPNMQVSALLMPYDIVKGLERIYENTNKNEQPLFATKIREDKQQKCGIAPAEKYKPSPEFGFALTFKVSQLTKDAYAQALDQSNFNLARNIVKELRDISEISSDDTRILTSLINEYEQDSHC